MKVALLTAHSRVSPVFETTLTWLVIEAIPTERNTRSKRYFLHKNEEDMAHELLQENVEMIICGASPYYLEKTFINQSCEVFSFIAGDVDEVIKALHLNQLDNPKYRMPGCQKRKKRENNASCKRINS